MTDPETGSIRHLMDGVLRPAGPGRWDAFLPSPSPQNHAASLARLPGGELACVWFGGTMEGMPDISIHLSVFDDSSSRWTSTRVLDDDRTRSEQNPMLFTASDGRVWLLYTSQVSGNQETSVVRRRISSDGGRNFGPANTMIDAPGTFIRQPIVRSENGDLLLPVFKCRVAPGERWTGNHDTGGVYRSSDGGATWTFSEVPSSLGCVHMNIVPQDEDNFVAFFRSRWADFIYASHSHDGGRNWSVPNPTALPNNNSSIQCARLSDGRLAMVYNHASAGDATGRRISLYDEIEGAGETGASPSTERRAFWGAPRAPLSLVFSTDDGESWQGRRDIDTSDGYCLSNNSVQRVNRELSYPVLLEGPAGSLDIAFTWFRQGIKHVRIALQ